MDSSKHTPGKWYVTGKSDVNGDHLHIASPESMMVMASLNDRHIQTKANAEFIVRACNAHEQLVHALQMVRDADDDAGLDNLPRIPAPARAAIDAALTAAGAA